MKIATNRINTIGSWLQREFGEKVVKLSIDGGFTCPNRDGTKGVGGCIFCSAQGSGELASDIPGQISLLREKWPKVSRYIAYFQSHTSTYAPVSQLRHQFYQALAQPNIVGLAISTRPDCLSHEVLDLLSELNEKTFLWIELGLQTIHGDNINRCYDLSTYDIAVQALMRRNIKIVTHLILGLPSETQEEMIQSAKYVCRDEIFGLKLHLMNVIKGSYLGETNPDYLPFASIDEYVSLVCDILEIIPSNITIHRLTGDVPRNLLLNPPWSYKKRTILNSIHKELSHRNTAQGCNVRDFSCL